MAATANSRTGSASATALLNSVTRLPVGRAHNGTNLNLRFHPRWLRPEALASLMRTYFELGGSQVQFNIIDTETLRDAQRNPEAYRDLVVRVAGFTQYWVEIGKPIQDEVIARTEYEGV